MDASEKVDAEADESVARDKSDSSQAPRARRSTVAKVSHTLSLPLAERLEQFAFFQRVSESSVIEHSLRDFFALSESDSKLGDVLRRSGAGRRRKN